VVIVHTTSTDIFDTVLLRGAICEKQRFLAIARLSALKLVKIGVSISPDLVLRSRREAQFLGYRALEAEKPDGDLTLVDILKSQAGLLGLDAATVAPELEAAELEVECAMLRPNKPLLSSLRQASTQGNRIIAISDTYLSAAHVGWLLDRIIGSHPIDAVYTSADLGLTKRSGSIFKAVIEREGISPADVSHMGDDHIADLIRPVAAGLSATHLPRPRALRLLRRWNALAFRHAHGAMP
jgi:FMN phosphatase YigB (HAD superfamily)